MATMNLNTADLPEPDSMEPVPAGEYDAEIEASDVVDAKSGNGVRLNLTLNITSGAYAGRKIFDGINFQHSNEIAQKIGQQTIRAICNAVGFDGHLDDSTRLHGVPLMVRVVIDAKDERYRPKNVVKGYRPVKGASAPNAAASPRVATAAPAQAPAKPVSGGAMPWKAR